MANKINFLREGLKNIKTVGTITRSSRFLCRNMVSYVDYQSARWIVEIGAGDGVITRHILEHMHPDAKLMAFEVLGNMCEHLREIDDPRLIVVEDSALELGHYMKQFGFPQLDAVISAVPFVAMPEELAYSIVRECKKHLKPGAPYIQVHYSLLARKMYQEIFGNVDTNFVPLNVPPAFVLVSKA